MYLYRAIDSSGRTIDFWLNATRDAGAAKHRLGSARRTITGYEVVVMIDKGQVSCILGGKMTAHASFIAKLFDVGACIRA